MCVHPPLLAAEPDGALAAPLTPALAGRCQGVVHTPCRARPQDKTHRFRGKHGRGDHTSTGDGDIVVEASRVQSTALIKHVSQAHGGDCSCDTHDVLPLLT